MATLLSGLGAACEPFRAHLDDDIKSADVERTIGAEPYLNVARSEIMIVGFFRTRNSDRDCVRQASCELAQLLVCQVSSVCDLDDRHGATVEPGSRRRRPIRSYYKASLQWDDRMMRDDNEERFIPLSRISFNPPWWQRLPKPVEKAGLRVWSFLPQFVRAPLVPIGRLFYPHTTSGSRMPQPKAAPGVEYLLRQGFEPLANFTGADDDYGPLWPVEHRRESAWPDEPDGWPPPSYPRWFVRSPWPGLTVQQVTDALWMHIPADYNSMYDPTVRDAIVADFFRLDQGQVERLWLAYNSDD